MSECPYCRGTGEVYVDPKSTYATYRCPDCRGTGNIPECDVCGNPYSGEYCEECYTICPICRVIRNIREEMVDTDMCVECREAVKEARNFLHQQGIASYRVSDEDLADLCQQSYDEVMRFCKTEYQLDSEQFNVRYLDNIKKLCMSDDYNCQAYSTVKCGFCQDYGVAVEQLDSECDADGEFDNWRATCINCGVQSLDMDDPAYAVEVLVEANADGVKDAY